MSTHLEPTPQQSITIRVVFDGAPKAGKTTAAYALSTSLGSDVSTPVEDEGRTVWFDFLAYSGGVHEGNAIRVELVTVPGQEHLDARRRHLLSWGDVVVFIADTSGEAFEESAARYHGLRSDLEWFQKPVIIVANKRDRADAVPLAEVRQRMGLTETDVVIESIATSGTGVREAFIYAVRAALTSGPMRVEQSSADELLAEMRSALLPASVVNPAASPAHAELAPIGAAAAAAPTAEFATTSWSADPVAEAPVTAPVEPVADVAPAMPAAAPVEPVADVAPAMPAAAPVEPVADELAESMAADFADSMDADFNEPAPLEPQYSDDPVSSLPTAPSLSAAMAKAGTMTPTEPEPVAPAFALIGAKLNPEGIADGGAVVIVAEHWRILVDIADGRSSFAADSPDAKAVLELVEWGLVSGVSQDRALASVGAP